MTGTKPDSLLSTSFSNFLKGLLMGGANIIPGVSGGTLALIVGIYERLIEVINLVFNLAFSIVRFQFKESKTIFRAIDWLLLIPLAVGIGAGSFLFALLINYLLPIYPIECRGLFFGLITASIAVPWSRTRQAGPSKVLIAAVACVFAFLIAGLAPQVVTNPSNLHIFGAAAIAICAMILPGVSGAFLLLVLGLYASTTEAIQSLDMGYIAIFGAGAVVGIGAFSRLLKWLLENHHDTTMAALAGLMVGSLRALWPWQAEGNTLLMPAEGDPLLWVILLAIVGFITVISLVWWENRSVVSG